MELRVKGPNVTPGYLKRDDLTKKAFDDEGFYLIGDAGRLVDKNDPSRGIDFDGRVVENFKLCLLYTSPSPRDVEESRMPSSA